jgi:hypothetical protein
MSVADRTYSFRASAALGERMKDVQQTLAASPSPELTDKLAHEFILALLRRDDIDEVRDNQSAFMRMTIELLATASEKIKSDAHYTRLFAEARDEAGEDEAERRDGVKRAAARRWQNR